MMLSKLKRMADSNDPYLIVGFKVSKEGHVNTSMEVFTKEGADEDATMLMGLFVEYSRGFKGFVESLQEDMEGVQIERERISKEGSGAVAEVGMPDPGVQRQDVDRDPGSLYSPAIIIPRHPDDGLALDALTSPRGIVH